MEMSHSFLIVLLMSDFLQLLTTHIPAMLYLLPDINILMTPSIVLRIFKKGPLEFVFCNSEL